ncbi:F-box domain-containing protein [Dioscorea alata]|uniref:F-box domain-containing protein n=1 Tax=Dioscorea alata TaxID=55571 RepID=A0ACB7WT69_DIOAL|nr:F-box domain-containing protein [Dioscorea alata]
MAETKLEGREAKKKRRAVGSGGESSKEVGGGGDGGEEEKMWMDPMVALGPDILTRIMEFLDARSVARSVVVSRAWYQVATSDHIWSSKCEELWKGKAHIPRVSMLRGVSKLEAYSLSFKDGKRKRIMKDDLCDHVWEFRFQKSAPEYWLNLDPSWKGSGPPMRRYFHPDGSQTADPTDQVWGGHESQFSIVTSYVGNGEIREHYVRINRWPPMTVIRKEDWSWELFNKLYHYNSIPDASKEGGTGPCFPVW